MPERDLPERPLTEASEDVAEGVTGPAAAAVPHDEAADPAQPHHDDGLDLARTLSRAAAAASPQLQRRLRARRSGPPADRRLSGSHPDDRDPQLLGGEVSRLVGERGWELSLRLRGVFARWSELVGAEIADHCTPETFADGRLVVRTDSTAWATQLRLLAPDVVRRLNDDLGPGTVVGIEVLGPHLPTWKKGPRTSRDGRGPRDTYG